MRPGKRSRGRPAHTAEQKADAYERKKRRQQEKREERSRQRVDAAVDARVGALQRKVDAHIASLPWWAVPAERPQSADTPWHPAQGEWHPAHPAHPASGIDCWLPSPACATPRACAAPDGEEFCEACWASWEAEHSDHECVSHHRRLCEEADAARRTAEREAGEAEQKRRKGGRLKEATWDTEDGRARLLARRAKRAARDARRRQRKREASARAQSRMAAWEAVESELAPAFAADPLGTGPALAEAALPGIGRVLRKLDNERERLQLLEEEVEGELPGFAEATARELAQLADQLCDIKDNIEDLRNDEEDLYRQGFDDVSEELQNDRDRLNEDLAYVRWILAVARERRQRKSAFRSALEGARARVRERLQAQQPVRRVRQRRRSGSAHSVARSDQCEGTTLEGRRCRVDASMTRVDEAAPLRVGGRFCAHHEPEAARAGVTRCAATRRDGKPCRVTSACSNGRTLREGAYCRNHLSHAWTPPSDCAGVDGACAAALGAEADASVADALGLEYCDACTASWWAVNVQMGRVVRCRGMCLFSGRRCMVNSLMPHDGAKPLRAGEAFCASHMASQH